MQIDITFRRMDPSDALRNYLTDKMGRIRKFLARPSHAHVVLTSERFRNKADITLTLNNGLFVKGVDTSDDMYFSIDQALTRIEKQLRKYKEKIQSHKPAPAPALMLTDHTLEADLDTDFIDDDLEPAAEENQKVAVPESPRKIVSSSEISVEPMDVNSALMQLELQNSHFFLFVNAQTKTLNVVYRREDGAFGVIETNR
ncbi:ribosome-associated translation inhibitor RaiA [Myxococcota bacterium]|jgi:putative sigma-54 modulation protein|nr:ribosome-associated translation inhibitor RaiA [Myxococcota bacterium]MBU1410091.1 ribosome-associated translation inhibitor RaiA [Myxococcota bacterium]MBU1508917.1 ribosome-associated translation inhibitor RaiA [Myxococcota bacterium]PKN27731.1 MAG: ribosomal subunit interface protein [Deltaproteobacteria bacterium HGW-Deltaproteobacteria-22]